MIVVQTPLRISFLGGGTDFEDFYTSHGGACLSTAIDKYVFVIVKKRFDDMICVNYSKRETSKNIEKVKHNLVREALKRTGISKGIEITTLADIPSKGTGLGSSSSVTVGLLHALYSYKSELKTEEDLAREACQIEIDVLKNPIGKQDQYIGAYGNLRFITFNADGINVETIQLSDEEKRRLSHSFLLFYTGITRKSESVLAEQKANINHQIDILIKMRDLSYKAKEAVLRSDFDEFGELMHEGWEHKKMLASNVTNGNIDEMYKTARQAGAVGGKITGAGGGGFLLLYCRNGSQDRVRSAMRGLRELPFNFERDGSKVIFNYRRS